MTKLAFYSIRFMLVTFEKLKRVDEFVEKFSSFKFKSLLKIRHDIDITIKFFKLKTNVDKSKEASRCLIIIMNLKNKNKNKEEKEERKEKKEKKNERKNEERGLNSGMIVTRLQYSSTISYTYSYY